LPNHIISICCSPINYNVIIGRNITEDADGHRSSPYQILNAVINLNADTNKELVIRQKIIWSHTMRQGLNIGESSIPTGVLPEVIAWFGDDDPNRDNGHIIQYHEPPLPYETIRVVRLNSIYRIARSRSDFIHSRGNTFLF